MSKEQRFDIHQHITNQIVAAIEPAQANSACRGIAPPVTSCGRSMSHRRRAYRGINVLALWATAEEKGYSSGTWGTYRQWAEIGAQVRKGEKAAFIVFYKELEFAAESETGDAETTTRLFARATPVFAAEQVEGYRLPCPARDAGRDGHRADRTRGGFRRRDRRDHSITAERAPSIARQPTRSTCRRARLLSAPRRARRRKAIIPRSVMS